MMRMMMILVLGGIALALSMRLAGAAGAVPVPAMALTPSPRSVNYDDGSFQLSVTATDVTDLSGYGFRLKFNTSILKATSVTNATLLASTGRVPVCPDPLVLSDGVVFGCYSNGEFPAGPNGDGTLAVLTLQPIARGTTTLEFINPQVSDHLATTGVTNFANGSVTVIGGPEPAPPPPPASTNPPGSIGTPNDGTDPGTSGFLTSDETGAPGSGTVQPPGFINGDPASAGPGGSAAGQAGSGAGRGQAGSGGGSGGFGLFGFGQDQRSTGQMWALVAIALGAAGCALLLAGVAKRRSR